MADSNAGFDGMKGVVMTLQDIVTDIESKISPQIEKMIEQGGYVKKSKYENLERIISDLEDRLDKLEKN